MSKFYSEVLEKTSFGKTLRVLRNSNIENFIQTNTDYNILMGRFGDDTKKINNKDDFYKLIIDMFQSLTTRGFTTYEILEFINVAVSGFNEADKKEVLDFLSNSIKIFYSSSDRSISRLTNTKKLLYRYGSTGNEYGALCPLGIAINSLNEYRKKQIFNSIATLSVYDDNILVSELLKSSDPSAAIKKIADSIRNKTRKVNLNKSVVSPTKSKPSFSVILLTNPKIKVGTQNSLEISTFFNGLTNIELSQSYPYLNATFTLPTMTKSGRSQSLNVTSSTTSSFLFNESGKENHPEYSSNLTKTKQDQIAVSNMSMFTMPQTFVNMDEFYGHSQNKTGASLRRTSILDPTQPFMTLKSFSINSAPTKGLMSYKSGKLSLVLHDRARMNDIAPFVKPDLFGSFGAEITLEYGWSNNASNTKESKKKNPIGYFIDSSKVLEKYQIVNSNFNIDNNGQVNIDLSIAMKGAAVFKNNDIKLNGKRNVTKQRLASSINLIYQNKEQINNEISIKNLDMIKKSYISILSDSSNLSLTAVETIASFIEDNSFVRNKDDNSLKLKPSSYIVEAAANQRNKYIVNLVSTSLDKEEKIKFAMLMSGSASEIIKAKGFIIESTNDIATIKKLIDEIVEELYNLLNMLEEILLEDEDQKLNKKSAVDNIIGGISIIDPFFPSGLKDAKDCVVSTDEFVSLGTIISSLVQTQVINDNNYDETQLVFYTANEYSGKMSGKSLSTILVRKTLLKELLDSIYEKKKIVTPESLITQIILKCAQTKDNVSYGLSDIYERRKSVFKPAKSKSKEEDILETQQKILKKIYGVEKSVKVKFKMPVIGFNFDCFTTKESSYSKTILRISIFDRNDSPYQSTASILESLYNKKASSTFHDLVKNRKDFKTGNKSLRQFENFGIKEITRLKKSGILDREGKIKLDKVFGSSHKKIKDFYKSIYPSLTFGTQNTALINASVSTINDNKLSTIFMTRPDRNDQSLINSRENPDFPLVILPTQATVEIVGCPWVNFGQMVFLDFETGTTIDNRYVVTGITHNLEPGKFTTSLTLSYGDTYGQLLQYQNILEEVKKSSKKSKSKRSSRSRSSSRKKEIHNSAVINVTKNTTLKLTGNNAAINAQQTSLKIKDDKNMLEYFTHAFEFKSILPFIFFKNHVFDEFQENFDEIKKRKEYNKVGLINSFVNFITLRNNKLLDITVTNKNLSGTPIKFSYMDIPSPKSIFRSSINIHNTKKHLHIIKKENLKSQKFLFEDINPKFEIDFSKNNFKFILDNTQKTKNPIDTSFANFLLAARSNIPTTKKSLDKKLLIGILNIEFNNLYKSDVSLDSFKKQDLEFKTKNNDDADKLYIKVSRVYDTVVVRGNKNVIEIDDFVTKFKMKAEEDHLITLDFEEKKIKSTINNVNIKRDFDVEVKKRAIVEKLKKVFDIDDVVKDLSISVVDREKVNISFAYLHVNIVENSPFLISAPNLHRAIPVVSLVSEVGKKFEFECEYEVDKESTVKLSADFKFDELQIEGFTVEKRKAIYTLDFGKFYEAFKKEAGLNQIRNLSFNSDETKNQDLKTLNASHPLDPAVNFSKTQGRYTGVTLTNEIDLKGKINYDDDSDYSNNIEVRFKTFENMLKILRPQPCIVNDKGFVKLSDKSLTIERIETGNYSYSSYISDMSSMTLGSGETTIDNPIKSEIDPENNIFYYNGIAYQSIPYTRAADIALFLRKQAVAAGCLDRSNYVKVTIEGKNRSVWDGSPGGKTFVGKYMYKYMLKEFYTKVKKISRKKAEALSEKQGNIYSHRLGTINESKWSSWFMRRCYLEAWLIPERIKNNNIDENYIDGLNSNQNANYTAIYGAIARKKIEDGEIKIDDIKDREMFLSFDIDSAPAFAGDAIWKRTQIKSLIRSKGQDKGTKLHREYNSISTLSKGFQQGGAHMQILVPGTGKNILDSIGGNERSASIVGIQSNEIKDGKFTNSHYKGKSENFYYNVIYKRVRVLGPEDEIKAQIKSGTFSNKQTPKSKTQKQSAKSKA